MNQKQFPVQQHNNNLQIHLKRTINDFYFFLLEKILLNLIICRRDSVKNIYILNITLYSSRGQWTQPIIEL